MSLEDDIKKAEKHLEDLKRKQILLNVKALDFCKQLDEYTDVDKIEHFDKLYEYAYSIIQEKIDDKWHEDNDNEHYAYSSLMLILARNPETFWKSYKKFFK